MSIPSQILESENDNVRLLRREATEIHRTRMGTYTDSEEIGPVSLGGFIQYLKNLKRSTRLSFSDDEPVCRIRLHDLSEIEQSFGRIIKDAAPKDPDSSD